METDSQIKTLQLLEIQLLCIRRGYSLGGERPRGLRQSPLSLLMSGNPSQVPYAQRSFNVPYQHTMHSHTRTHTHTHTRLTMLYSLQLLLHQEAKASARPHSAAHLFGGPYQLLMGFPGDASGKEPSCQCRRPKRCAIDPWVRKIP